MPANWQSGTVVKKWVSLFVKIFVLKICGLVSGVPFELVIFGRFFAKWPEPADFPALASLPRLSKRLPSRIAKVRALGGAVRSWPLKPLAKPI